MPGASIVADYIGNWKAEFGVAASWRLLSHAGCVRGVGIITTRKELPVKNRLRWLGVVAIAVGAAAVAVLAPGAALASLRWDGGNGAVVVGLTALALFLVHAAFVDLPRTMAAARAVRPRT